MLHRHHRFSAIDYYLGINKKIRYIYERQNRTKRTATSFLFQSDSLDKKQSDRDNQQELNRSADLYSAVTYRDSYNADGG